MYGLSLHKIFVCIHMVVRPSSCGPLSAGVMCCLPLIFKPSLGRREKLPQKVGRREKLAEKVGRREIYRPVPPPSFRKQKCRLKSTTTNGWWHFGQSERRKSSILFPIQSEKSPDSGFFTCDPTNKCIMPSSRERHKGIIGGGHDLRLLPYRLQISNKERFHSSSTIVFLRALLRRSVVPCMSTRVT